jgi:hypothetical protein
MAIYQPNISAYERINSHIHILIDLYQNNQIPRQSPYYLPVSRVNSHLVINQNHRLRSLDNYTDSEPVLNQGYQRAVKLLQTMIANDWHVSLLIMTACPVPWQTNNN